MHIIFATPEISPFSQATEVAEFTRQLAAEIKLQGHDISVITPLYRWNDPDEERFARRLSTLTIPIEGGQETLDIFEGRTPENVRVFFLANERLFGRSRYLYPANKGRLLKENGLNYGAFSRAVCEFVKQAPGTVDILQIHDWATALVPIFLEECYADEPKMADIMVVQSLLNLHERGNFSPSLLRALQLPEDLHDPEQIGEGGQISFAKGGVLFSDVVLLPSPTIATELQQGQHVKELEAAFAERAEDTHGILLGIDDATWDPSSDGSLPQNYDPEHLNGKRQCKAALQNLLKLPMRPRIPVVGIPGPLLRDRGADLITDKLSALLEREIHLVVVGGGSHRYTKAFEQAIEDGATNLAVQREVNPGTLNRLYAGCDLMLFPHHADASGLEALRAMRYGTLPILREVGALADFNANEEGPYGFSFTNDDDLLSTLDSALEAFAEQRSWRERQLYAMTQQRSWIESAQEHIALYESLL